MTISKKSTALGLTALLLVGVIGYVFSSPDEKTDRIENDEGSPRTEQLGVTESGTGNQNNASTDLKNSKPLFHVSAESSQQAGKDGPNQAVPQQDSAVNVSPFTDENFEDWVKLGSTFASEKKRNPIKYKAGIDFLINTLKYGNVDKMLSQAAGTLYNIDDPELTPIYENILKGPDSDISPEGKMRVLTLYIRQAAPESKDFKEIIAKYEKDQNIHVRSVAQNWRELRK